ncbi:DUF1073 domain-containing protein [Pseudochelatococcus contaminans]|uniref:Anti-CBASS protein Acb1-like N-terminal domain-containing protein n=1 Tax=Pseudochelatococcus contaminans TaxID=1538103 RepID=A0A7W5Z2A8_9HYPH|nr:DUF1073 domain-containing protein [Pseudochelatococcus contaminans]MBB3808767.1 hypothetical protein [Pseudochelatococcus contaminans]
MARRQNRKRAGTGAPRHQTTDSFQNVAAKLGIGTNNIASGGTYAQNAITRQRAQLEWMYRGSWIVGQAVDCVAEDMTRAGIDITSSISPEDIDVVQAGFEKRAIWQALNDTIKWSRLYGGAIAVILVEGQDVSTPLRVETVSRGQFKGLLVLDRWTVVPALDDVIEDYGPDLGRPKYYDVMISAPALRGKRVHYSRVIRMEGVDLPYWQRVAEYGWGLSIVERLYDRLLAFDSSTQGVAQLVYKAHLRTVSVDGLREILAAGGPGEQALTRMFEMVRLMQSNEGLTLLDAKDNFQAHSYTFSGLSDVLLQFAQQISGALQIPLVRLFGQSPAGLNATGDADIRNYYDMIAQQQEAKLRAGIVKLLALIYRSDIGNSPPKDMNFKFNSLWQMSETERATIAVGVTGAVVQAADAGLVSRATALKELKQSADVSGVWDNITGEDIAEAENDPLPREGGYEDVPALPGPDAAEAGDDAGDYRPGAAIE